MGDYLITFQAIDTSGLPADMDGRRREMARLMAAQRVRVKENVERFLNDNGLMDKVSFIGEPLDIQMMVISCTQDVARALRQAGVEGVEDVMENSDMGQAINRPPTIPKPPARRH